MRYFVNNRDLFSQNNLYCLICILFAEIALHIQSSFTKGWKRMISTMLLPMNLKNKSHKLIMIKNSNHAWTEDKTDERENMRLKRGDI